MQIEDGMKVIVVQVVDCIVTHALSGYIAKKYKSGMIRIRKEHDDECWFKGKFDENGDQFSLKNDDTYVYILPDLE